MAVRPIVVVGDPVLHNPTVPVRIGDDGALPAEQLAVQAAKETTEPVLRQLDQQARQKVAEAEQKSEAAQLAAEIARQLAAEPDSPKDRAQVAGGQAQLAAGAHVCLVFDPAACPELVPVPFFTDWIGPRIANIFRDFKAAGASANWLHIAGNALPILPFYQKIGADIGNFDYTVEPENLIAAVPKALCLDGNIKPLAFVEDTPDMIEAESCRLIDSFASRGGFILSSGCEIPPEAKPENIEAMVKAAKRACFQHG